MLAVGGAEVVTWILGAGAVMGGMGYAAGQFISSRRKALGDSLQVALNEVTAYKNKTDRLEGDVKNLKVEVAELREANTLLREAIASGAHIAPAIEKAIRTVRDEMSDIGIKERTTLEKVAREEHKRTREMIERLVGK